MPCYAMLIQKKQRQTNLGRNDVDVEVDVDVDVRRPLPEEMMDMMEMLI